ncbi:hypothetical protein MVEG_01179 [Podila verticillata NRRL 6337]|nr:hypothetical protein MVEG_01179 [Podila verticillata NRRL 6337]
MSEGALAWANVSTLLNNHIDTRKKYQGTVDHARAYAAELDPDLASALGTLSDKTVLVLREYVRAMFQEGHSYSEIEDIRDAMKQYFDDTFRCIGTYWLFLPGQGEAMGGEGNTNKEEKRGEWIGNPVYDAEFVSLMQELKGHDERSEGTRQAKRRAAIGYEDVTKLVLHLQKPETIKTEGLARCLFFQAFVATAFTLWLTFDEVLKLKRGNVHIRQSHPDEPSWFSVTVPFRNSNPINPAQANVYKIYPQPEEPHACCVSLLLAWIQQLELNEGRRLQANEFLFPDLADNDQIQLEQPFSVSQVSDQLIRYAADAGLTDHRYNSLDTHCFRRGGAQHRLSYAQGPWPFRAIKWWGGWSEKERAEKILEYLLDDFQYEANFGDIMSPCGSKTRVHAGTAGLSAEMMVTRECFKSTIRSMESRHATILAKIEKEVLELRRQNAEFRQESTEWRGTINLLLEKVVHMLSSRAPDPHRRPSQQLDQSQPPVQHPEQPLDPQTQQPDRSQQPSQHPEELPLEPEPQHSTHQLSLNPSKRKYPQPLRRVPIPKRMQEHPLPLDPSKQKHPLPLRQVTPQKNLQAQQHQAQQHPQRQVTIPPIAHWKDALKQWEEGDPANGLDIPLSKWPSSMRYSTFSDRKLVVKEFEAFGCSEDMMRAVYGESMDGGVSNLTKAIRRRHKLQQKDEEEEVEAEKQTEQEGQNEEALSLVTAVCDRRNLMEKEASKVIMPHKDSEQESEQVDKEKEAEEEGKEEGSSVQWPDVPLRLKNWKQAVEQWEIGDPIRGLKPISTWPEEWKTSSRTQKVYVSRKTIAEEFEFFGRDEARMRQVHGINMERSADLVQSIRRHMWLRKQKKAVIVVDEEDELEEEEESLIKRRKVDMLDVQEAAQGSSND